MKTLFVFLLLSVSVCAQLPGWRSGDLAKLVPQVTAASYVPYAAEFDGANDFMAMNGSAAAMPDGKAFTVAFWCDPTGGDGTKQDIWWTTSDRFVVFKSTTNTFNVVGFTTGGTKTLDVSSSVTKTASDGWTWVLITCNLAGANTANCRYFFNGTEDTSDVVNTFNDNVMDFDNGTSPARRVGAGNSGNNKCNMRFSEFWLAPRVVTDTTKFYNAGNPVDLGSNGSAVDGSVPAFYFSRGGSGNSWNTESANGYTFTITGSLGSPTPPP